MLCQRGLLGGGLGRFGGLGGAFLGSGLFGRSLLLGRSGLLLRSGGFGGSYGLGGSGTLLRTRAAAASFGLLGGLHLLRVGLVEVNQLDQAHLGSVAQTKTGLQDTAVSARTVGDLRSHFAEQFGHGLLAFQIAENDTTGVGGVLLRFGNQRLHIHPQSLRLGDGRLDPLVQNQRAGQIGQQRLAMSGRTPQVDYLLC